MRCSRCSCGWTFPSTGTYHAKPVPPKRAVTVEFPDAHVRDVRERLTLAFTCPVTRALLKALR